MNKTILGVCTLIEIAGVVGLTAIGHKRNNDAYKAEVKCINLETELIFEQIKGMAKDIELKRLKKELEQLKKQQTGEA